MVSALIPLRKNDPTWNIDESVQGHSSHLHVINWYDAAYQNLNLVFLFCTETIPVHLNQITTQTMMRSTSQESPNPRAPQWITIATTRDNLKEHWVVLVPMSNTLCESM